MRTVSCPIRITARPDRYAYGANNPVRFVDPTGHEVCLPKHCGYMHDYDGNTPAPEWLLELSEIPFDADLGGHNVEVSNEVSTAEKVGLGFTGVETVVGFSVTEISLGIIGVVALDLGPIGVIFDTLVIFPAELFLVDTEIALTSYIYDVVTTGTKEDK